MVNRPEFTRSVALLGIGAKAGVHPKNLVFLVIAGLT